jgi:protoporphyrinogen oxidase
VSAGKVIIVGAGPCGLGCARELTGMGHNDFELHESGPGPGGLASSIIDEAGFTWDHGGHVVFSHYGEFDRLLQDVMGDDVVQHDRSSYVRIGNNWVPYPFQNNLHYLPAHLAEEALAGLVDAQRSSPDHDVTVDFESWMMSSFGPGICRLFMRPYNEKVWAYPPSSMSASWIAERVSIVDWRDALHNVIWQHDDLGWGPNNKFLFPISGGTGEIYRRAATAVDDHIQYNSSVRSIDPIRKLLVTSDGVERPYDRLVWTGALDILIDSLIAAPDAVKAGANELTHNSVTVVGVGYRSPLADDRSWMYFPGDDVPFYRATNFAKYAAANVPGGRTDQYSSWMTEVASSPHRPLDTEQLGERVDQALRSAGLVNPGAETVSLHLDHIERAYPIPTLGRDDALATIQPWLMEHDIYSRGRFGAWRYELGNMDHAVKMGVDVARLLVDGTDEQAWTA